MVVLTSGNTLAYGQLQKQQNETGFKDIVLSYTAGLNGGEQVPTVKTDGIGIASLKIIDDKEAIH
ncbi:MAG: hypothetical protein ACM31H_05425, partial [Nitrososphaerales archaeon]